MPGRERHRLASTTIAAAVACACAITPSRAIAADDDPWLGRDKFEHFVVTGGIAAETYVIAVNHSAARTRWSALAIGAGVAIGVGAAKEGWDALGHGDPSWRDFAWDVIGTASGLVIAWGVDLLVRGVDDAHPLFRAPAAVQF